MTPKTANDRQIGGSHYRSSNQHWDFVEDNGVGYLEGCATKYVTRHRKKNGLQDLEKAKHYLEKLVELALDGRQSRSSFIPGPMVDSFNKQNELGEIEGRICHLIFKDWSISDLKEAIGLVENLMEGYAKKDDNTGQKNPFGFTAEEA